MQRPKRGSKEPIPSVVADEQSATAEQPSDPHAATERPSALDSGRMSTMSSNDIELVTRSRPAAVSVNEEDAPLGYDSVREDYMVSPPPQVTIASPPVLSRQNSKNASPTSFMRSGSGSNMRRSRSNLSRSFTAGGGEGSSTTPGSGKPSNAKFFVPGTPDQRGAPPGRRRSSMLPGRTPNPVSTGERLKRLRLLQRDAPFFQSSGRMYMHRSGISGAALARLAFMDLFHVALSMPLWLIMFGVVVSYTLVMIIFAGIYMGLDHEGVECGVAPPGRAPSFYQAFAFSMETFTTIGYGIPNSGMGFFDDDAGCGGVLVAVYFQAMAFILMNAAAIGVLFARISSANNRANQIIFSNKAVIRCVRHRFYFMFQVGEASYFRYHPVVEAHVRVYAVLHEEIARVERKGPNKGIGSSSDLLAAAAAASRAKADAAAAAGSGAGDDGRVSPEPSLREASQGDSSFVSREKSSTFKEGQEGVQFERAYFQTRVMRLTNPNDELGGVMFLATPQIVSHRIDPWSPMCPPAARKRADSATAHDGDAYHFPGLVMREADREVAIADEAGSPATASPSASPKVAPSAGNASPMLVGSRSISPVAQLPRSTIGGADGGGGDAAGGGETSLLRRAVSKQTHASPGAMASSPQYAATAGGGAEPGGGAAAAGSDARQPDASNVAATGPGASETQLRLMQGLIRNHIERSHLEVIVIVEAIDPHSSNTFQARHSYTADDIEYDRAFETCMNVAPDGRARLDWDLFHTTKQVPFNAAQIIGGSHS